MTFDRKAWRRAYYEAHKEKILTYARAYRDANRERIRAVNREGYKTNPEKHKQMCKRWRMASGNGTRRNAIRRQRYQVHREEELTQRKELHRQMRALVLEAYGNKCTCCGESTFEFLTIDHINGNGATERKELRLTGSKLYWKLRKEGFPKDNYRILCLNCNAARGFYGYCPHTVTRIPDNV